MYKKTTRIISMILALLLTLTILSPTQVYAAEKGSKVIALRRKGETTVTVADNEDDDGRTIDKVPLFNQGDYPDVPYGEHGSVASHGCGITCVAMVVTYLTDEFHSPADLALQFGNYNTPKGSYWSLFKVSAEKLGVIMEEQTYSWTKVKQALRNGQVVVSIQSKGLFTDGGHFIVLTGINEDGKITVNDPNGNNWTKNAELINGFANGFEDHQITDNGSCFWIYGLKSSITEDADNE